MQASLNSKRIGQKDSAFPTIVLLHGFMGQLTDWLPLLTPYLETHDFLLIDLPGHGHSHLPSTSHKCGFMLFEQAFCKALKDECISEYYLYGYSLGGRLALYHAAQQPAGLKHLMLESCHPGLKSTAQRLKRSRWLHKWQQTFNQQPLHQVLQHWYQQTVFASLSPPQRQQQITKRLKAAQPRHWSQALGLWSLHRQPNLSKVMNNSLVPIKFLVGTQDPNYAKLARKMIRAQWPIEIALCRNAGHNVHATTPSLWHKHFSHWLMNSGLDHD